MYFSRRRPRLIPRVLALGMPLLIVALIPLCRGQVVVSEVMWMGSDLSTADEWVELLSTATDATDIAGWTLTSLDGSGNEAVLMRFGSGTIVPQGSTFLIANYGAAASRLSMEPQAITTGMSLPNTKLFLRLRTSTGAIIDTVDDGVGAPFAGSNISVPWGKASMERIDPLLSGTLKENWRTAKTFRGFDDGARLFGTPGYANGTGPAIDTQPPTEAMNVSAELTITATGTALQLAWAPSASLDLASQLLTVQPEDGTGALQVLSSATKAWAWTDPLPHSSYSVRLQSRDDLGNTSTGVVLTVQPTIGIDTGTGSARLAISELLPDPIGTDADEWVELVNTGDRPADLREYRLSVGSASSLLTGSLLPGAARIFPHSQTKLTLKNTGDTVRLLKGTATIDELSYPALPEGVSFGRLSDEPLVQPFCAPTPSAPNALIPWTPQVVVQSGELEAPGKTSVNLVVTGGNATLAGGSCHIDFGDGSTADSCNPPSHAFKQEGTYSVSIQAVNYCGTTVSQSLNVRVDPKGSTSKVTASTALPCTAKSDSGVVISEILPNPDGDERQGEWVELSNTTCNDMDLCAWWLDDEEGGSKPFALAGQRIEAQGALLIQRRTSGITLDNDDDRVRLLATATGAEIPSTGDTRNKRVVQEVLYDHAPPGKSFALRQDGVFVWTPYRTPGEPNRFVDTDVPYGSNTLELSALPQPANGKQASQWIGITNRAEQVIILSGWSIQSSRSKQKPYVFDYRFILPNERIILKGEETDLDLKKTDTLQLKDDKQRIVSALHWQKAQPETENKWKPTESKPVVVMNIDPALEVTLLVDSREVERRKLSCIELYNRVSIDYLYSLLKAKMFDLQFYSTSVGKELMDLQTPENDSLIASLLRSGYGILSADCPGAFASQFEPFEAFARDTKAGLWASDDQVRLIDAHRKNEKLLADLQSEGLHISLTPKDTVVRSGSGVRLKTNVPAQLYVSVNGGKYLAHSGALAIHGSTSVQAYAIATVQSGTGEVVFRSSTVTRAFVEQRKSYAAMLAFSEVYPSPLKNGHYRHLDEEWVELENRTGHAVTLGGWSIADTGKKKPKPLPVTWTIPGNGRRIITAKDLSITLNDSGDELYLIDPLGNKVDHIKYPKMQKGDAIQRGKRKGIPLECSGVSPSPGTRNSCQRLAKGKNLPDSDHDLLPDDRSSPRHDPAPRPTNSSEEFSVLLGPFACGQQRSTRNP